MSEESWRRSADAAMMDQSDAVRLRRRRLFVLKGVLLSGLFTATGLLMAVLGGDRIGYISATFFGLCAAAWACRLLTPRELLLQLPASHFEWLAPRDPAEPPRRSEPQSAGKPSLAMLPRATSLSDQNPQRIIGAVCPNCGPSRIRVVLEGAADFVRITSPRWSSDYWAGRCCKCHAPLETHLDNDQLAATLEWTTVDEKELEFLLGGSSPPRGDSVAHPLWDAELDD
jgi:hypothetical protein